MNNNENHAVLWCREGEDFGILVYYDFDGKSWKSTVITADITKLEYLSHKEAEVVCVNRPLYIRIIKGKVSC